MYAHFGREYLAGTRPKTQNIWLKISLGMDISKMKMIPLTAIKVHITKGDPMRGIVSLMGIMIHLVERLLRVICSTFYIEILLYFLTYFKNINKVNPVFFVREYGISR